MRKIYRQEIVNSLFQCVILFLWVNGSYWSQTWSEGTEFPGIERDDAIGFSIGNKGYAGSGRDIGFQYRRDFYRYENGQWSSIPAINGEARQYCSSFSFDTLGCVLNGVTSSGEQLNEMECFSELTQNWHIKPSFLGSPRQQAVSFSIGEIGYCGLGRNDSISFNDWYGYNSTTEQWFSIVSFPEPRFESVSFVLNGIAYVGLGSNLNNETFSSFFTWSPITNSWSQIADFPGNQRTYSIGLSLNDKGYVCTGVDENNNYSNEVWEYNPLKDEWTQLTNFPYDNIRGVAQFNIKNCAYLIAGLDESSQRTKTNYEICDLTATATLDFKIQPYPSSGVLDISNLAVGSYFLKILNEKTGEIGFKKIVKV